MRSLERDLSMFGLFLLFFGGDLLLDFRCLTRFLLLSLLLSDDKLLTDSEEDEDEEDEEDGIAGGDATAADALDRLISPDNYLSWTC